MADPGTSAFNKNPTGKNQYPPCPGIDDPKLVDALDKYHRQKLDNNTIISERLKVDHGIDMAPSTVKRRRKALGLLGSRSTMKTIDPADAEQLVFAQMDADISKRAGVRTIQRRIASEEKVHLPRDFVSKVMHSRRKSTGHSVNAKKLG